MEFEIVEKIKNEINSIEEVELPENFNTKLHTSLEKTINENKKFKFENYTKFAYKFVSAAAAVVLIAVAAGGYYLYNRNFDNSTGLSQLAKGYESESENASDKIDTKDTVDESVGAYELSMLENNMDKNINEKSRDLQSDSANIVMNDQAKEMSAAAVQKFSADSAPAEDTAMKRSVQKVPEEENTNNENNQPETILFALSNDDNNKTNFDTVNARKLDDIVNLNFEVIAQGIYSNNAEKRNYVITNENDFKDLWEETISDNTLLPKVDFSKQVVLAVYQGTQNSGGYSTSVVSVQETKDNIEVLIKESKPEPDMMVTMALTSPYEIIKIDKTEKKIIFKYNK